jgi:hypothetical protein
VYGFNIEPHHDSYTSYTLVECRMVSVPGVTGEVALRDGDGGLTSFKIQDILSRSGDLLLVIFRLDA